MIDYEFDTSALRETSGEATALSTSRDGDEVDLIATDHDTEFQFQVAPGHIRVTIENRGNETLSWDLADASFMDGSGETHQLCVLRSEDPAEQPRLEVPPRSTVQVFIWPRDWRRGYGGHEPQVWRGDSPLNGSSTIEETTREAKLAKRHGDIGKIFEIVLPLSKSGERVSYRFRFTVSELVPRKTWWA